MARADRLPHSRCLERARVVGVASGARSRRAVRHLAAGHAAARGDAARPRPKSRGMGAPGRPKREARRASPRDLRAGSRRAPRARPRRADCGRAERRRSGRRVRRDSRGFRSRLGIPPEAFIVLFLGRMHRIKRLDLIADAFAAARAAHPSMHLVLAGPDEHGLVPDLIRRLSAPPATCTRSARSTAPTNGRS